MYTLLLFSRCLLIFFFFFFNDTATTEIYTLSLHDALPILRFLSGLASLPRTCRKVCTSRCASYTRGMPFFSTSDRKSTRLNSSHDQISYAVFCLKKKKK